jgi:hypothetical protein
MLEVALSILPIPVLLGMAIVAWPSVGGFPAPNDPGTSLAAFPLEVTPSPVLLGSLKPEQSARARVVLRNRTSRPIVIDRVETECSCIHFEPLPLAIGAGQCAAMAVVFDPTGKTGRADRPDSVARLLVAAVGHEEHAPKDIPCFQTTVRVEVRP